MSALPDADQYGTTTGTDTPLRDRIKARPRPAVLWVAGLALFVAIEFGALMNAVMSVVPWALVGSTLPVDAPWAVLAGIGDALAGLPTLLSREVIPNQGYRIPGEGWQGTFLGLEPAHAWGLRVLLVYGYAFALVAWTLYGYELYRRHYRKADWTPRDDVLDRLRGHRWGQFGLIVVLAFVIMAVFAPALGPTTVERNIAEPFEHEFKYYDEDAGDVRTTLVGEANLKSVSTGQGGDNVGPMQYDTFDRFHPFGTLPSGKDLFTFMASGARVSLSIGLLFVLLASTIAVVLALISAYYKGVADLAVVLTGDSIQAMPQLLVLILLSFLLGDTFLGELYDGALVLAIIFAATGWPLLWRAVRGPALQVSSQEWITAAESYGQSPRMIMQKHMFPYVVGYLMIYASLSIGGAVIGVAGLSFLGLGVSAPTPEWGRAVSVGQPFVATASWHISLIPGILVVLVVTGFNALGDGLRDAIDPKSEGGEGDEIAAAGGTGA